MNLTSVATTIKNYKWLIICLIVVWILVIFSVANLFRHPKQNQPSLLPPSFEPQTVKTQSFSKNQLTLNQSYQKQLPIYNITSESSLVSQAPKIAAKLGFNATPEQLTDINLGDGQSYSNDSSSLTVYPQVLSYQKYGNYSQSKGSQNIDTLHQKAVNFISSLGLPVNFSSDQVTYQIVYDEFTTITQDPQKANLTTITLNRELSGIPVTFQQYSTKVTFDAQGNITKLVYSQFPETKAGQTYDIIDPKTASEALLAGQGVLLRIESPNSYEPTPANISAVDLESVNLSYFLNAKDSIVQPIWMFKGKSENGGIIFYAVPAIDPKFFTQP